MWHQRRALLRSSRWSDEEMCKGMHEMNGIAIDTVLAEMNAIASIMARETMAAKNQHWLVQETN